jgi:2-oxoisovalerate dehydrogenase E1 component beta subunit
MLNDVMLAAEKISKEHGIETEVVEPISLYPLDRETILRSAKKTGKTLVVSEANLEGSVSGEIAALVAEHAFEWLDGPVRRLGSPDSPAAPFARPLTDAFVPTAAAIEAAMLDLARY